MGSISKVTTWLAIISTPPNLVITKLNNYFLKVTSILTLFKYWELEGKLKDEVTLNAY